MIRRLAAALAAAAAVSAIAMPAALGQVPQSKPSGIPLSMSPDQRDPKTGVVSKQGAVVSGQFTMNTPGGVVEEIDIRVDFTLDPKNPVNVVPPTAVCQNSVGPCGQQTVPFSYALPPLAYNGPYQVTAWAFGSDVATSHAKSDDVTLPGGFRLAVPPRPPANASAKYDASSRFTIVTWDRNPEPDMHYYIVRRKGPSDKDFKSFLPIYQPKSAPQVSVAEKVPPGEYQYQIDAWRAGPDGNTTPDLTKDVDSGFAPEPPLKVTVPVPPPGPAPAPTPSPAPTLKSATSSQLPKPRSSSFSSSSKSTTLTTESVSPDAGFARGSADVTSTIPGGSDDSGRAIAILPKSKNDSSNRLAIFGPVAGGAVLFMFAFHLRYLKGRLDQIPPPA